MKDTLSRVTQDLSFLEPASCVGCEFAGPDGPYCPRNTAIAAMLAVKASLGSTSPNTRDEAATLAIQIPEMSSMAEECASGMQNGEPPLQLRTGFDGVTVHIMQSR